MKIDSPNSSTRLGIGAGLCIQGPLRKATLTRSCTDVYNPKVTINSILVSMKILLDVYAPIKTEGHEKAGNIDLSLLHKDLKSLKNIFCLPVS